MTAQLEAELAVEAVLDRGEGVLVEVEVVHSWKVQPRRADADGTVSAGDPVDLFVL